MLKKLLLASVAVLALGGCATALNHPPKPEPMARTPLLDAVLHGADRLASQLKLYRLQAPVVVASAQNNDKLTQVCQQGRLLSDIVSSRLTQHGIPVTEVRLTQQLRISGEGETILSRELSSLAEGAAADVVVTSTWTTLGARNQTARYVAEPAAGAVAQQAQTYVTLKAVRLSDGLVLSSQTFESPVSWTCD